MANEISNVNHEDYAEHTLNFKWNPLFIRVGNGSTWSTTSLTLDLDDGRQCILEMRCKERNEYRGRGDPSIHNYSSDVTMGLKAIKDFCFKVTEKITMLMHYINQNHTFHLRRVNNKEFTSDGSLKFDHLIVSNRIIPFDCKLVVREGAKHFTSVSQGLIQDFTLLLNNGQYSDLIIEAQDKIFKVHKNIVFARNEVLSKHMEHDTEETKCNKIPLNQWNPVVVKEFLTFLYTGTCDMANSSVELFRLADYLSQSDLLKIVKEHMMHDINVDNFVALFELADSHDLRDLYDEVKKCFLANRDRWVKHSDFESYLCKSIKASNIKFVLETANHYKLKKTLPEAIEFVKDHYEEIAEIPENRDFIKQQHDFLFEFFEHAVGYLTKDRIKRARKT